MRRRLFTAVLALVLVVSLLPAAAFADNEALSLKAGDIETDYTWKCVESEDYGKYYELTNVTYVGEPVAADYQSLHIYVPAAIYEGGAVNGFTAETAPVIMANSASGWAGKTPSTIDGFGRSLEMDWAGILEHGYVLVSIGTRGPATQNDDGTYNGKAPENVADAKAAVRFLKANDALIPGDMERIISAGTSGGGGMSTIIGASGNAEEYLPYLYEMDACGVEKDGDKYVNTGDDSVYGMLSYAAITDLDNADLGYNWFYGAQDDYSDFEKAVVEDMAAAYEEYVLSYGIWADMDEFTADFVAMFEASLNDYLASVEWPIVETNKQGEVTAQYEDAKAYIAAFEWLAIDEEGKASIAGDTAAEKIANLTANHNGRGKGVLGFDNLTPGTDSRAENQLFGLTGTTTNRMHFSETVAEIMLANKDEYSKLTEGEARYSKDFKGNETFAGGSYADFQKVYSENEGIPGYADMIDAYETALTDEMKARVYMMNPVNYILEYIEGSSDVKPAEHFRSVYGSTDSNTSPTVIFTLKSLLEKAGIDTDYSLFWNGGHGNFTKEAAETEAFFAWVESICGRPTTFKAGDAEADYEWKYVNSEKFVEYYEITNVVYVGAPVAEAYQSLHIYAPTAYLNGGSVNGYTAETAPIIMANSASGWAGKTPSTIDGFGRSLEMDWAGILEHGYVLVSIGTRGPATQNDDGTYNGKAPENVADAKAAVRFLKANDALIPGDMEKIISAGTSGGGGMSTIIGASGNAEEYLPYLYEMDACGVEKDGDKYVNTGDDSVFGMLAYAPITDLDNADLGYNWFYGADEDYSDFEKAVAEDMSAAFEAYILDLGAWKDMDEFAEGFVAMFEDALNAAGGEEGDWIVRNADGTYSIAGADAAEKLANITANHNSRGKTVLGFDNLTPGTDSRAENQLFGLTGTTTNRLHYSEAVANIMLENKAEYSKLTEGEERWSEGFRGAKSFAGGGYTAFQKVYSDNEGIPGYTDMIDAYETALNDEMKQRVYMMNPINYIIEFMEGSSSVKPAEHFRGVYGSDDSNTSPTVIYTVKGMLEKAGIDTDYSMFWNGGHGKFTKEKAETENFFSWVEAICKGQNQPETGFADINESEWFYKDVMYASEKGLMYGVGADKFDPAGTASRAMVVTVLYRIAGEPEVNGTNGFTDLSQDWYKNAVQWAVEKGITKGVSDTLFNPDAPVTRQEIATFLYRFAEAEKTEANLDKYEDVEAIAPWALDAMSWAISEGIITGMDEDTLAPDAQSTRAQLATILARYDRIG